MRQLLGAHPFKCAITAIVDVDDDLVRMAGILLNAPDAQL